MIFLTKRKRILNVIDKLSVMPASVFKAELTATLNDIENGNIPDDSGVFGPFTPELIKSQDNWRFNPKVIHVVLSLVVAECVAAAIEASGVQRHHVKPDLRHLAIERTQHLFERVFREQVGNDVFDEYKAANPHEFS